MIDTEHNTAGGAEMKAASYDYNVSGGYADAVATLDDGRRVWINTQYGTAKVRHSADCAIG